MTAPLFPSKVPISAVPVRELSFKIYYIFVDLSITRVLWARTVEVEGSHDL